MDGYLFHIEFHKALRRDAAKALLNLSTVGLPKRKRLPDAPTASPQAEQESLDGTITEAKPQNHLDRSKPTIANAPPSLKFPKAPTATTSSTLTNSVFDRRIPKTRSHPSEKNRFQKSIVLSELLAIRPSCSTAEKLRFAGSKDAKYKFRITEGELDVLERIRDSQSSAQLNSHNPPKRPDYPSEKGRFQRPVSLSELLIIRPGCSAAEQSRFGKTTDMRHNFRITREELAVLQRIRDGKKWRKSVIQDRDRLVWIWIVNKAVSSTPWRILPGRTLCSHWGSIFVVSLRMLWNGYDSFTSRNEEMNHLQYQRVKVKTCLINTAWMWLQVL